MRSGKGLSKLVIGLVREPFDSLHQVMWARGGIWSGWNLRISYPVLLTRERVAS